MATETNDKQTVTQTGEQHHHHSHHHHEHHHHKEQHGGKHVDGSERFKRHNLSAAKRRKLMEKWTFRLLCVVALIVTLLCFYLYYVDN